MIPISARPEGSNPFLDGTLDGSASIEGIDSCARIDGGAVIVGSLKTNSRQSPSRFVLVDTAYSFELDVVRDGRVGLPNPSPTALRHASAEPDPENKPTAAAWASATHAIHAFLRPERINLLAGTEDAFRTILNGLACHAGHDIYVHFDGRLMRNQGPNRKSAHLLTPLRDIFSVIRPVSYSYHASSMVGGKVERREYAFGGRMSKLTAHERLQTLERFEEAQAAFEPAFSKAEMGRLLGITIEALNR